MRDRIGALSERDFRLVFSSTTISAIGDGVAAIALVFAVLHISHNSPNAVGVVLACRQVAGAAIALAAGVIADRLPRHLVLVVVAAIQAAVAGVLGVKETLIAAGVVIFATNLLVVAQPVVWSIPAPVPA